MTIYEILRDVNNLGITGVENLQVHFDGKAGPIERVELRYDNDGFPFVVLGST